MRRVRRILINVLTALSLLLSVATAVLWGRSATHLAYLHWRVDDSHYLSFSSAQGIVRLQHFETGAYPTNQGRLQVIERPLSADMDGGPFLWWSFGLEKSQFISEVPFTFRYIWFPHWLLTLTASSLPVIWLLRWRRCRRAARLGLCPACGYDLRATPERCPECGTVPGKSN